MPIRDRNDVLRHLSVSRETIVRLDIYVDLLERWQGVQNLVSSKTLADLWTRHIWDSAQLLPFLGPARHIADLGSGAGFPGLVLAILLSGTSEATVHLVESNRRKAAFLQEVVRATGVKASVHPLRIEDFVAHCTEPIDVIVARALAPVAKLLALSEPLLKKGARALFLKGQDVEMELTQASKSWRLTASIVPSVTDSGGRILRIDRAVRI